MNNKWKIAVIMVLTVLISGVIIIVNNRPSKAIFYNWNRYVNQNTVVPTEYLDGKIGSKAGYAYWKIVDTNENYYLAVKIDKEYYFYKTSDANGINFGK